ncbi:hypothetical protein HBI56_236700 [Parastagonospora nodorum]|uniref:Uncharacterized protein n=1 Tax=Phaeosphaeria nodorum (strain SN15 / ATCC MYA-4574 / FGSC 10173) TaxID=321614 RepID=A0A7U2I0U1_PHANO|nr:hypothetical protein HBH56_244480 [Parastagonospora nodorum]QRC95671.1 hypothetical protein JI435_407780 [Parastagonospora nodorum SN15]KAH3937037.1 hypothetical protein HBH54_011080 [Parastagonospora nodorum]KAH3944188.1 hypothetical protein HBH53_165620 [Parastagonospora nodorum]KAH3967700.1 hypothetical protein HBH51_134540 [Parastagonospora nodorum]
MVCTFVSRYLFEFSHFLVSQHTQMSTFRCKSHVVLGVRDDLAGFPCRPRCAGTTRGSTSPHSNRAESDTEVSGTSGFHASCGATEFLLWHVADRFAFLIIEP